MTRPFSLYFLCSRIGERSPIEHISEMIDSAAQLAEHVCRMHGSILSTDQERRSSRIVEGTSTE